MDTSPKTALIEDADRALLALDPVKRRLVEALSEPGSASGRTRPA